MCCKEQQRWNCNTAIFYGKKFYEVMGEHVGVVENTPGNFTFFPIKEITEGVVIHFRTDKEDK